MSFGSVLVALHRDHIPGGLDLGPGEWRQDPVIVLEPAATVRVRVVDSVGEPQPLARVHHVGEARAATMYGRFLRERAQTDSRGEALLTLFPGEQAFWAEKDELVSVPWHGMQPTEISLILGESFTIGGTLDVPDWSDWDPKYQGERRIIVDCQADNLWRPVMRLRDVEAGAWGPLRIPLVDATQFRVRLEGAPLVPIEETFQRPPAFSHRRVDFVAERGAEIWFLVIDEARKPIPNAMVHVWWGGLDRTMAPYVVGAAGKDGIGYAGTFPPGKVRLRATAPSYAEAFGEATVPSPEGVELLLHKGGRIVGKCSHGAAPVRDFEVIYWSNDTARQLASQQFIGRMDGSFTIDNLAPGEWFIHAASSSCPPAKPEIVEVALDRDAQVELELAEPIPGGGRVVSADTGAPIPQASIQPFSSGGVQRTYPWGQPVQVNLDGTFEVDAFVLGINHITVEAQGFGSLQVKATATSPEFLDWGDIRLFEAQRLRISLVDPDESGKFRPAEIFVGTAVGHPVTEQAFSAAGIVEFEGFPAGDHTLDLSYPDGSWTHMQLRLTAGEDWHFEHKLAGDKVIRVRTIGPDGRGMPDLHVMLAATEPKAVFVTRMKRSSSEGDVTFEGVRASQAQIMVFAPDGPTLATKDVLLEAAVAQFEVVIGGDLLEIVVRDIEGAMLPGADLTVRSSSGDEILGVGKTDSRGVASLAGIPERRAQIDIRHGIAGWRFGIPIDASVRRQEFVLDAQSTLELHLKDGDMPLADVASRIETASGITLSHSRPSDVGGHIEYPPLGQGSYRIVCRRADCWTTSVERTLDGHEDVSLEVQMRRLADLDLTVFADGLPATGVDVDLRSVEFDTDVRDWIEQGSIRAPGGLTTGSTGSLRVEGLPRGVYAWTAQLGEQPQSGTFELLAAETGKTRIHLLR